MLKVIFSGEMDAGKIKLSLPKVNSAPEDKPTRLLVAISVPLHVKKDLHLELDNQVKKMCGYISENLHISLGVVGVNLGNQELLVNLIQGLSTIFQGIPWPEAIELGNATQRGYYVVMPVNKICEAPLQSIYKEIIKLVEKLQNQYGEKQVLMDLWKDFSTHVTLYGALTEALTLPNNDSSEFPQFIPTKIQLLDNKEPVYSWAGQVCSADGPVNTLLQEARRQLQEGMTKGDLFQQEKLPLTEFLFITRHFKKAQCYFKKLRSTA